MLFFLLLFFFAMHFFAHFLLRSFFCILFFCIAKKISGAKKRVQKKLRGKKWADAKKAKRFDSFFASFRTLLPTVFFPLAFWSKTSNLLCFPAIKVRTKTLYLCLYFALLIFALSPLERIKMSSAKKQGHVSWPDLQTQMQEETAKMLSSYKERIFLRKSKLALLNKSKKKFLIQIFC